MKQAGAHLQPTNDLLNIQEGPSMLDLKPEHIPPKSATGIVLWAYPAHPCAGIVSRADPTHVSKELAGCFLVGRIFKVPVYLPEAVGVPVICIEILWFAEVGLGEGVDCPRFVCAENAEAPVVVVPVEAEGDGL